MGVLVSKIFDAVQCTVCTVWYFCCTKNDRTTVHQNRTSLVNRVRKYGRFCLYTRARFSGRFVRLVRFFVRAYAYAHARHARALKENGTAKIGIQNDFISRGAQSSFVSTVECAWLVVYENLSDAPENIQRLHPGAHDRR
jgi:hypothetical protein